MTHPHTLKTLAQWLAGEFANRSQAIEQSAWFHLHLYHCPLPQRIQGNLALFAEQANFLYLERTYRQRVILLQETEQSHFQVQYLALKQPEKFRGAGANPRQLSELNLTDLNCYQAVC